jgi:hypothetical protein
MNAKILAVAIPTAIVAIATLLVANLGLSEAAIARITNLFPKSRK